MWSSKPALNVVVDVDGSAGMVFSNAGGLTVEADTTGAGVCDTGAATTGLVSTGACDIDLLANIHIKLCVCKQQRLWMQRKRFS